MLTAMSVVQRWAEMIKFSHSIFAMPFALIATFLASRAAYRAEDAAHPWPSVGQLVLIVICMVAARSVAMTFNRIVDAVYDVRNPRTAGRAIPAGSISRNQATLFLVLAATVFILACAGFGWLDGNYIPLVLSIPVLAYLCFYSYTKRFTTGSHFVLGSAIAFSPVAAWLAIHPVSIGWPAVLLMGAVTCWIAGFDIIYACQDIAVDRKEKLFSIPSRLGPARALWIARISHFVTVVLLLLMLPMADLGWLYLVAVILVAMLLAIENAIVHPNDFSRVNLAFFTLNGVVSLMLGLLAIIDCLLNLRLPIPGSV